MDIHHLKVFLSVFKNKSFSKSSNDLNLTQPTISAHIKAIEEEFGCKLFDRIGRTIIPTKEAKLLYSHASVIVENIEEIKTDFGLLKKDLTGELEIGASTIPGTYIIPSLAAKFKKKYPDVYLQMVIEDSKKITDMVLSHELLLGVVGAKMDHKKTEYLPFIKDKLVLVSSPGLLEKTKISFEELADIPFIIREEGSGTRKTMEEYLSEKGIGLKSLNVVAVFGSTDAVKEAVKSGLGASIISRLAVKDQLNAGTLIEIKLNELNMIRSFYIITHKKRTLPKLYRTFLDYLIKHNI